MSDIPNYSAYHLDELERALSEIDETTNPEEARVIRECIEKGGYSYPPDTVIDGVKFVSPVYKWSLVFILSVLLLFNLIIFIDLRYMLSLLTITLQASLLFMIFSNHRYARAFIKIWTIVVLVSSIFGFLSMYFAPEIMVRELVGNLLSLAIGLTYLIFADRSIHLVSNGSNN